LRGLQKGVLPATHLDVGAFIEIKLSDLLIGNWPETEQAFWKLMFLGLNKKLRHPAA
jgi:hypothetical protein